MELLGQRRSSVRLRTTTRRRWYDGPLVVRLDAGGLFIEGARSTARVELALPPGVPARVRLRTGDVTLWGASGALDLDTGRGQIAARDLGPDPSAPPGENAPTSVLARATGGPVNLHLRAQPDRVEVDAGGNVALVVPHGCYHVQATAARGAPVVEVAQGDGPLLRLVSRTGSVRIAADAGPAPI